MVRKSKRRKDKAIKSAVGDKREAQSSNGRSFSSQWGKTNEKNVSDEDNRPPMTKRGRGRPPNTASSSQKDSGLNTGATARRRLEFEGDLPDDIDIREDTTFFKIRVDKDEDNFPSGVSRYSINIYSILDLYFIAELPSA